MTEITYGKATPANIELARKAIKELMEETKSEGSGRRTEEKTVGEKFMAYLLIDDYGYWEGHPNDGNEYWMKSSDKFHCKFDSTDELNGIMQRYGSQYPMLEFNWEGGDDKRLKVRVNCGGESEPFSLEPL